MYRLDKSHFKIQSFNEADNHLDYWLKRSVEERFAAAWYLISSAWGFDLDHPPRLDKTCFSSRKNGK